VDKYRKTLNILILLLAVTTGLCIYAFMRKGSAVAPISLFMYRKDAQYFSESHYGKPKFWDNYPYWILISQGQQCNLPEYLDADYRDMPEKPTLFFRLTYSREQDSVLKVTMATIINSNKEVIILADEHAATFLAAYRQQLPPAVNIFKTAGRLPVHLEQVGVPYFFVWSAADHELRDLFVPRVELPETTARYINYDHQK